jgi:hypothetical protein
MEPESSSPHSQLPATCSYRKPHKSSRRTHPTSWKSILILSSHPTKFKHTYMWGSANTFLTRYEGALWREGRPCSIAQSKGNNSPLKLSHSIMRQNGDGVQLAQASVQYRHVANLVSTNNSLSQGLCCIQLRSTQVPFYIRFALNYAIVPTLTLLIFVMPPSEIGGGAIQ